MHAICATAPHRLTTPRLENTTQVVPHELPYTSSDMPHNHVHQVVHLSRPQLPCRSASPQRHMHMTATARPQRPCADPQRTHQVHTHSATVAQPAHHTTQHAVHCAPRDVANTPELCTERPPGRYQPTKLVPMRPRQRRRLDNPRRRSLPHAHTRYSTPQAPPGNHIPPWACSRRTRQWRAYLSKIHPESLVSGILQITPPKDE